MGRSGAGWQGLLCNTATSLPPTMYYAGELLVCLQPPRSRDPRHPRDRDNPRAAALFAPLLTDNYARGRFLSGMRNNEQSDNADDTEGWLIMNKAGGAFGCGGWPLWQTGQTGFTQVESAFLIYMYIWMCDNNFECVREVKLFLRVQTKLVMSDLSLSAIKLIKHFLRWREQYRFQFFLVH